MCDRYLWWMWMLSTLGIIKLLVPIRGGAVLARSSGCMWELRWDAGEQMLPSVSKWNGGREEVQSEKGHDGGEREVLEMREWAVSTEGRLLFLCWEELWREDGSLSDAAGWCVWYTVWREERWEVLLWRCVRWGSRIRVAFEKDGREQCCHVDITQHENVTESQLMRGWFIVCFCSPTGLLILPAKKQTVMGCLMQRQWERVRQTVARGEGDACRTGIDAWTLHACGGASLTSDIVFSYFLVWSVSTLQFEDSAAIHSRIYLETT